MNKKEKNEILNQNIKKAATVNIYAIIVLFISVISFILAFVLIAFVGIVSLAYFLPVAISTLITGILFKTIANYFDNTNVLLQYMVESDDKDEEKKIVEDQAMAKKIEKVVNNVLDFSDSDITEIPSEIYSGTNYEKIIISDKINSIDKLAFKNCNNLKSVVLSNSVEIIGNSIFKKCELLCDLEYKGTKKEFNNLLQNNPNFLNESNIKTVHCIDGDIII
ncbi:MAG: leucine-rich repeat protein [Bacilli bacterium]|nr:leucine-rich repeat protein [Bacilli bacterium]